MNLGILFLRTLFVILSVFFMTLYMMTRKVGSTATNAIIGVFIGLAFGLLLIGFDRLFKRFNLRSFNIAVIGLFIGYMMGQVLVLILNVILDISRISFVMHPHALEMIKIALFLFGTYLGTIMILKASDELYVSIPFIRFTPTTLKKKDVIVENSVLTDARILDAANTGLFDHQLIIPRFAIKELYAQAEVGDELTKMRARRGLETIKNLEHLPHLDLKFHDTDFPDVQEPFAKLLRLARLIDANILTADIGRTQAEAVEGIRIINVHALANALKPLMQAGEMIKIKVQRFGKEPRQGVGYLEDGTMVVINGGGDYLGEIVTANVLSVKHTTSGRMVFCNVVEEGMPPEHGFEDDHKDS